MNATSGPGDTPLLGVSSCLLGNLVRYDGGGKPDHFLKDRLGAFVEFVPVCPEVECGLPVPREPMRLVNIRGEVRLLTWKTRRDITAAMTSWVTGRIGELRRLPLCGFVFKSKSPSSGMRGVKVYDEAGGLLSRAGVGLFARSFMETFPDLPVEDELGLRNRAVAENFVERVFMMHHWRAAEAEGFTPDRLAEFHARHGLVLMSHSSSGFRMLDGMAAASTEAFPERLARYRAGMMRVMALRTTPRKHARVLHRISGFLGNSLKPEEKAELASAIDDYRLGLAPRTVPVNLLLRRLGAHLHRCPGCRCYLSPRPWSPMLDDRA